MVILWHTIIYYFYILKEFRKLVMISKNVKNTFNLRSVCFARKPSIKIVFHIFQGLVTKKKLVNGKLSLVNGKLL